MTISAFVMSFKANCAICRAKERLDCYSATDEIYANAMLSPEKSIGSQSAFRPVGCFYLPPVPGCGTIQNLIQLLRSINSGCGRARVHCTYTSRVTLNSNSS